MTKKLTYFYYYIIPFLCYLLVTNTTNLSTSVERNRTLFNEGRLQDSTNLVRLFNATAGTQWDTTWTLSQPMDTWKGIMLNVEGRVVSIVLNNNNLSGRLPNELGELSELERLFLNNNKISGSSLHDEYGKLTKLKYFSASNNQISGIIHEELGDLTNLKELDLSDNFMSGNLPDFLRNLTNLEVLELQGNALEGDLPMSLVDNVTNNPNLRIANFSSNNFSGCFPDNYTDLCNFEFQELNFILNAGLPWGGNISNLCDGSDQIGASCNGSLAFKIQPDCTCQDVTTCRYQDSLVLVEFYEATNGATWNNPWDLTQQPITSYVSIDSITGCVTELDLNNQGIEYPLPQAINILSQLSELKSLMLHFNNFTDSIPSEIQNFPNLEDLFLQDNNLTGTIPNEITNLTKLRRLYLYDNELEGELPQDIGRLTELIALGVFNNQLEGELPNSICELRQLVELGLSNNNFSGLLPECIGEFSELYLLWLNDNQFVGCFPEKLRDICFLTTELVRPDFDDFEWCITDNLIPCQINFQNNPELPWQGDISQFCAINGSQAAQIGAPCDDGNQYTYKDQIQTDCSCQGASPTIDCRVIQPASSATSADGQIELTLRNNGLDFQLWYNGTNINNNQTTFIDINENDTIIVLSNLPIGDYQFYTGQKNDISLGFCILSLDAQTCRQRDSLALVALYHSTDGPNWIDPWNLNIAMENWEGVRLNSEGCVDALDLDGEAGWFEGARGGRNLNGTIPAELGNLQNLKILILARNEGLVGTIPAELGNLSQLITLNFTSSKNITGTIPTQLGQLANLVNLVFYDNDLTGTIPTQLGNLVNLALLDLFNNNLTGTIPNAFQQLTNLKKLRLSENNLNGSIPAFLGNLSNLESLSLDNNQFEGILPTSLGNLSNLVFMSINNNNLEGRLPKELGNLINIEHFLIDNNNFIGEIPTELCNFSKLETFRLQSNQFSGEIPPCLGQLPFGNSLTIFNLSNNNLEGCFTDDLLPMCQIGFNADGNYRVLGYTLVNNPLLPWEGDFVQFCNDKEQTGAFCDDGNPFTTNDQIQEDCLCLGIDTTSCRYRDSLALIAFYNSTNGSDWLIKQELVNGVLKKSPWNLNEPIDTWFGVLINEGGCVNALVLDGDNSPYETADGGLNIIGEVPSEIGNLTDLEVLIFARNPQITGAIPPELGQLSKLTNFENQLCSFSGTIPSELGNLINLERLSFFSNQLEGAIPPELGNLHQLTHLNLYNNKLSGELPVRFQELTQLQLLNLSENQLSGNLPLGLGNLTSLTSLLLDGNNFSGTIPSTLGNLVNLERLTLSSNQFINNIPSELCHLTNLQQLLLNDNQLSSIIPACLGTLNFDTIQYFNFSNNNLSGCYPIEFLNICKIGANNSGNSAAVGYRFNGNPLLPWQGDFTRFCNGENQQGAACDDGNPITIDDRINENCDCEGVIVETCRQRDSTILANFYLSIPEPRVVDWDLERPIDSWQGIELNEEACVSEIVLENINLNRVAIPSAFGQLAALRILRLSRCNLSGTIPDALGDLSNLTALVLSDNALNGSIPVALGGLSKLSALVLNDNALNGNIPVALGELSNLSALVLNNNFLEGSIPAELGNLNLERFYLNENSLEGCFPESIRKYCSLNFSTEESNDGYNLTGNPKLPWQGVLDISFCNNTSLRGEGASCNDNNSETSEDIITSNCACVGALPPTCRELDSMVLRTLYTSLKASGALDIQWDIDKQPMDQWQGVTLNENGCVTELKLLDKNITGALPKDINGLTELEVLDVSGNKLSGDFYGVIKDLKKLRELNLANNQFTFSPILTALESSPNSLVFAYAPQASFYPDTSFAEVLGATLDFNLGIDPTITNNLYELVKEAQIETDSFYNNKITLSNLQLEDEGIYTIKVTNPNAPSLTLRSRLIEIEVTCPSNVPIAGFNTSESQEECSDETFLSASIPEGYTLKWTTNGDAEMATPNELTTEVSNLEVGNNQFFATLSFEKCEGISQKEVIINRINNDIRALGDAFDMKVEEDSIIFDVTNNDQIKGAFSIALLSEPTKGRLEDLGNGTFAYFSEKEYNVTAIFDYEICLMDCSEIVCDDASVILNVSGEQLFPNNPTFTPNDDTYNEVLVFEELTEDKYPNSKIIIFGRNNDVIYTASPYKNDWDGRYNGQLLPDGAYFFILSPDVETPRVKGYITIMTK